VGNASLLPILPGSDPFGYLDDQRSNEKSGWNPAGFLTRVRRIESIQSRQQTPLLRRCPCLRLDSFSPIGLGQSRWAHAPRDPSDPVKGATAGLCLWPHLSETSTSLLPGATRSNSVRTECHKECRRWWRRPIGTSASRFRLWCHCRWPNGESHLPSLHVCTTANPHWAEYRK
jgi:hypothetical protein